MILFFTSGINDKVAENGEFGKEIANSIVKYKNNDWGDLCADDIKVNQDALKYGGRILAAYTTSQGKVYIITDNTKTDEWVTTIMFAEEY